MKWVRHKGGNRIVARKSPEDSGFDIAYNPTDQHYEVAEFFPADKQVGFFRVHASRALNAGYPLAPAPAPVEERATEERPSGTRKRAAAG